MVKEHSRTIKQAFVLIDVLLIVLSFFIAYYLRNSENFYKVINPLIATFVEKELAKEALPLEWHSLMLWLIVPVWFVLLNYFRCYRPLRTTNYWEIAWALIKVNIAGGIIVGSVNYFATVLFFNRVFLGLFLFLNVLLLFALRGAVKQVQNFARIRGYNYRRVIIVGTGRRALDVVSELNSHNYWGFKILGLIGNESSQIGKSIFGLEIIGSIENSDDILLKYPIDDLFIAIPDDWNLNVKKIVRYSETLGISVHVVPDEYDLELARSNVGTLGNVNVISFSTGPSDLLELFFKKVIDIATALVLLPFFLIVYVVVAILIKLDSNGPVMYSQIRVTKNRRIFKFIKFRTMFEDADSNLHLLEEKNECNGPIRKSKDDPRITRVGRFLRKYSIDELPQIINVLKGEMSMVGPRPPTPDEVDRYSLTQLRKLSLRQGITGLWQVSGRDQIKDFNERLKLDLEYIDNWSIWLDLKILFKTIFVIFKGAI